MKNIKSLPLVTQLVLLYSISTISIVITACFIIFPSFERLIHINNLGYPDDLWSKCIQRLILALLLSITTAYLFGKLIARKAIQSVHDFSDKIRTMTLDSLADKVDPKTWPVEFRPLGESFNIMLDKLHNSFSQLSRFSADIAHELRNPIHSLMGINELALTKNNTTESYRQILESNLEECHYLLKLIEHLWFFARSDHGQIKLNKQIICGRQEILKIVDYYEPYANENDIAMTCEGEALFYVDLTLFKRVVSNILSNALRYTPKAGKISIKMTSSTHYISLVIEDTGIGIDAVHLPKIFDRFYRIDPSRSTQTGGLGLGLAIVKSIMDLHEGHITISSEPHLGTAISMKFPFYPSLSKSSKG